MPDYENFTKMLQNAKMKYQINTTSSKNLCVLIDISNSICETNFIWFCFDYDSHKFMGIMWNK